MENQHKKTTGYRDLSQEEIDLMNECKELEAKWNGLVDRIRSTDDVDQRQIAIAATDGESAFMRAVRSIARPERKVS